MKKYIILLLLPLFLSCEKENFTNNNPYLPNYGFSYNINMNLPQFNSLQFPSNGVYINNGSTGVRGIFVFNTGSGYVAFDAACPNQALSSCSTMSISGTNAICPCDEESYNLFTGLGGEGLEFPMKRYRTEVNGPIVRVYN